MKNTRLQRPNIKGDVCKNGARLCEPQHVPWQTKPLRVTDPRSASGNALFAEVSGEIPNTSRRANIAVVAAFGLDLGIWNFFGVWVLVFGSF
jgi:hypothetical protein